MDKIIEIKDLSFEYEAGLKTINHISFDINNDKRAIPPPESGTENILFYEI